MFWNKKEVAQLKRLDIVVNANSDQSNDNFEYFNEKLDLVIDHLNLMYVFKTKTGDSAKLVAKTKKKRGRPKKK